MIKIIKFSPVNSWNYRRKYYIHNCFNCQINFSIRNKVYIYLKRGKCRSLKSRHSNRKSHYYRCLKQTLFVSVWFSKWLFFKRIIENRDLSKWQILGFGPITSIYAYIALWEHQSKIYDTTVYEIWKLYHSTRAICILNAVIKESRKPGFKWQYSL